VAAATVAEIKGFRKGLRKLEKIQRNAVSPLQMQRRNFKSLWGAFLKLFRPFIKTTKLLCAVAVTIVEIKGFKEGLRKLEKIQRNAVSPLQMQRHSFKSL